MHPDLLFSLAAIALCALITWLTRALPFLIFGNRPLPAVIQYLGRVLPPAIMVILVIYCLRNVDVSSAQHGIPELAACLVVVLLQVKKKNMYLSILAGTILYMALLRLL